MKTIQTKLVLRSAILLVIVLFAVACAFRHVELEGDGHGDGQDDGHCPVPDLSVSTMACSFDVIYMFFSTGFEEEPPQGCFTNGTELYFNSRIDLFLPGGELVLSLPRDYIEQPANLEIEPIRNLVSGVMATSCSILARPKPLL